MSRYPRTGEGLIFWWFDRLFILIVAGIVFFATRLFCRVKVVGKDNVPKDGRTLFLSNHPSYIGAFVVIYAAIWPWILKDMTMFPAVLIKQKYRFLYWIVNWRLSIVGVPKGKEGRSQSVRDVVTVLKELRRNVWLFPAGTRDDPGTKLAPFNPGVGRIVAEARPRVVFVYDHGSSETWLKGQWFPHWEIKKWHGIPWPHRHLVIVTISKPLDAADSKTTLYEVCGSADMKDIGQPVADYLRDLYWAWVVTTYRTLSRFERPDYDRVLVDLRKL